MFSNEAKVWPVAQADTTLLRLPTACTAQGGPAFAGSNAATQTMLNKFKVVAKKGADIDAQV